MGETLVPIDRATDTTESGTTHRCPGCGSFLDAPRAHPPSGDLARKCAACRDWYPVVTTAGSPE
jgi:hypothetical protein